jgi:DNA-binding XRE family transcriptional regulator
LRTRANLSRQELAEQVGVHYQTIGYIERGEYSPSLVLALRIASVLETSIEEIFWLDEENDV